MRPFEAPPKRIEECLAGWRGSGKKSKVGYKYESSAVEYLTVSELGVWGFWGGGEGGFKGVGRTDVNGSEVDSA